MRNVSKSVIKWSLGLAGVLALTSFVVKEPAKVVGYTTETNEFVKVASPSKTEPLLGAVSNAESTTLAEVVLLTEKNTLVFRGPVTARSVAAFQKLIFDKSNTLAKDDVIYLVIDSPGGSVIDGNMLIDSIRGLPQKVKTITLFSASMAFQIVQNLDERLITPSGILMSHRASGGFEGEFGGDGQGELITRLKWILKILKASDDNAASRMGMSVTDYQSIIRDEYWVTGSDAVADKAADRMVLLRCSEELINGTEVVELRGFMGSAILTYSTCPIIAYPIKIEVSFEESVSEEYRYEWNTFLDKLLKDKRSFVKDYIINNRFNGIIK